MTSDLEEKPSVLLIDDEPNLCRSLSFSLREEGMEVHVAQTGRAGIEACKAQSPDIVLLDLKLPDMTGLEVLDAFARLEHPPITIMLSAHGSTRAAAEAVKKGAQDYITKPFDLYEMLFLIRRNQAQIALNRQLTEGPGAGAARLLGDSRPAEALRRQITLISRSDARTVLFFGPSGSGKTLAAQTLHEIRHENRQGDAPLITVSCGSLPETRVEAELFGTEEEGSPARPGLVARADGGTLILDEFVDLPLAVQAKLLGFIETLRYRPLGAVESQAADLTIVALTNRDPRRAVEEGTLREDLFYRLNVMPLEFPALAQRPEDIPLLVAHFLRTQAEKSGEAPVRLSGEAVGALKRYRWPGNVRELSNLAQRLSILSPGRVLGVADLPAEIRDTPLPPARPLGDDGAAPLDAIQGEVEARECAVILEALERAGGRKVLAAEWLGISRHALKRRMQKFGIGEYE